jgi:hypothetical protein
MIVTDKKYKLDYTLKQNLDFILERRKKKWDCLIIMDGPERSGKSTFARQIAYYLAYARGMTFTAQNIFFDVEDLLERSYATRNQMFILDEAAFDAMGEDWQNKTQKLLIKFLMVAAKYYHDVIYIIPKFKKLRSYIAQDRSFCLIRTYAIHNMHKGFFEAYSVSKKNMLYDLELQKKYDHNVKPDFRGRFFEEPEQLVDMEDYEKRKDDAILRLISTDDEVDKKKLALKRAINYLLANGLKHKDIAIMLELSETTIKKYAKA